MEQEDQPGKMCIISSDVLVRGPFHAVKAAKVRGVTSSIPRSKHLPNAYPWPQACQKSSNAIHHNGIGNAHSPAQSFFMPSRIFVSSLSRTGFVRNRSTPDVNASCCALALPRPVKAMIFAGSMPFDFSKVRICLVASKPSRTGMLISAGWSVENNQNRVRSHWRTHKNHLWFDRGFDSVAAYRPMIDLVIIASLVTSLLVCFDSLLAIRSDRFSVAVLLGVRD